MNGPAAAALMARVHKFLRGDAPVLLVPLAGGASVPFQFERETHAVEALDGGGMADVSELTGWFSQALQLGSKWTYTGRTWQVARCEVNKMAGSAWPHHVVFAGHAVGAKEPRDE